TPPRLTDPDAAAPQGRLNGSPQRRAAPPPRRKPSGCGARGVGIAFAWAMAITAPIVGLGAKRIYDGYSAREQAYQAVQQAALAHEHLIAAPAAEVLPLDVATL